jgi:hypothetical protein
VFLAFVFLALVVCSGGRIVKEETIYLGGTQILDLPIDCAFPWLLLDYEEGELLDLSFTTGFEFL